MIRENLRRHRWGVALTSVTIFLLVFTAITPVLLRIASHLSGNWESLSSVSQAYGLVASVSSSFALVGVAFSVYLQARETRGSRELAQFSMQLEMMKIALGDVSFITAGEPPHGDRSYTLEDLRREYYINGILRCYYMSYAMGAMSEETLRPTLASHMRSETLRRYWQDHGDHWLAGASESDGKMLKFRKIVNEEFEKSVGSVPGVPPDSYFS
ncbi:DUF6082 family protein [Streptomyces sp. NPDC101175]|uniref:DUF6082 family protein n=1 Tax=Streptomyces sp. NPDC101175 TaxID=3366123 RepID=UPI003837F43E